MLRSRIIPSLLVHQKGLVKTVKFKDPKYVGDPINAVKIFNEKEVDELIVIDIDATVNGHEPDFKMIQNVANECRMPLCYGGGVKTVEQAVKIIQLGVEKVAISSAAIENSNLLLEIAEAIGMQSVVVVVDVKKSLLGKYEIVTHNAKKKVKIKLEDFLAKLEQIGVGEVVINSVDQDGTMKGYDLKLCQIAREILSTPLTFLGGAGSFEHIKEAVNKFVTIGLSAGSLFVFKGIYRAVLISYLTTSQRKELTKLQQTK